jgi:hypothetical protein
MDGSTTTDRYVQRLGCDGEDSIMDMFRRSIKRFNTMEKYRQGLVPEDSLCQPPVPPETFTVSSGGDRIVLEWAENADSWPTFDGYQIYRAVSRPDTMYDLLFSCGKNDVVHRYDDISAKRGFNYYYYIVTKDDGSRNDLFPGVPLGASSTRSQTRPPTFAGLQSRARWTPFAWFPIHFTSAHGACSSINPTASHSSASRPSAPLKSSPNAAI